jgi:alcohol dehydrogenase
MAAADYPGMLQLITSGKFKPAEMITNMISLEEGAVQLKNLDKAQINGVTIISTSRIEITYT